MRSSKMICFIAELIVTRRGSRNAFLKPLLCWQQLSQGLCNPSTSEAGHWGLVMGGAWYRSLPTETSGETNEK